MVKPIGHPYQGPSKLEFYTTYGLYISHPAGPYTFSKSSLEGAATIVIVDDVR